MGYQCKSKCYFCKKEFDYELLRDGPNQTAHAYCNKCGMACVLDVPYLDKDDKWGLAKNNPPTQLIHPSVEIHLKYCTCGGEFKHNALPRCPHCHEELEEFKKEECKFFTIIIEKYLKNWWKEDWKGEERLPKDKSKPFMFCLALAVMGGIIIGNVQQGVFHGWTIVHILLLIIALLFIFWVFVYSPIGKWLNNSLIKSYDVFLNELNRGFDKQNKK